MFTSDLDRFESVMKPIANALYFKDTGMRYGETWTVFVDNLRSQEELDGVSQPWQPFRRLLATMEFGNMPTPHPDVFSYAARQFPDGLVLKLVFYGSFKVYCFGPMPVGNRSAA
jgi:hypothetical protein